MNLISIRYRTEQNGRNAWKYIIMYIKLRLFKFKHVVYIWLLRFYASYNLSTSGQNLGVKTGPNEKFNTACKKGGGRAEKVEKLWPLYDRVKTPECSVPGVR